MATATLSRKKTHVKKGDNVTVISGNHKGKSGRVLRVLIKKDQVLVEGVRMIKKHAAKSQDRPQGGIIEREGPLHISNVKKSEAASASAVAAAPVTKSRKTKKDA